MDTRDDAAGMGAGAGAAARERDGWFGPASESWRLDREAMLLLGAGPRALLLQIAHPLVAAGVAEHSDFRSDPWRRLDGTLRSYLRIIYGSTSAARGEVRRLNAMHREHHRSGLRGTRPGAEPVGPCDPRGLDDRGQRPLAGTAAARASGPVLRRDRAARTGVRRAGRPAAGGPRRIRGLPRDDALAERPGPSGRHRARARRRDPSTATPRGAGSAPGPARALRLEPVAGARAAAADRRARSSASRRARRGSS